jgi:hypothetical protein
VFLLGSDGALPPAGFACAQEPLDALLPEITPKELAARLRGASVACDKGLMEITFDTTANTNWRFMMNQGTADQQQPMIVKFPGKVRYQRDGRLLRVDYDSKMPRSMSTELSAYAFRAGFDGEQAYIWDRMRNEGTLGESVGPAVNWTPFHQFWDQGEEFADALEAPAGNDYTLTIGQRTVDGARCYTYTLRVTAPGRAWLEQDTAIGTDLRSQVVSFMLDQGDTISVLVRDTDGRPIAGASVDPRKWHHSYAIGGEVSTSPSGVHEVRSGPDGRFRIQSVRQGRFTLEVSAPGFEMCEIDKVAAGAECVDVALTRTKPPIAAKP